MNAIQQLRAQAIAAGNLVDCPEQRIVKEESCIRIVPAEPDVNRCAARIPSGGCLCGAPTTLRTVLRSSVDFRNRFCCKFLA